LRLSIRCPAIVAELGGLGTRAGKVELLTDLLLNLEFLIVGDKLMIRMISMTGQKVDTGGKTFSSLIRRKAQSVYEVLLWIRIHDDEFPVYGRNITL
jgi:hypothetical protein